MVLQHPPNATFYPAGFIMWFGCFGGFGKFGVERLERYADLADHRCASLPTVRKQYVRDQACGVFRLRSPLFRRIDGRCRQGRCRRTRRRRGARFVQPSLPPDAGRTAALTRDLFWLWLQIWMSARLCRKCVIRTSASRRLARLGQPRCDRLSARRSLRPLTALRGGAATGGSFIFVRKPSNCMTSGISLRFSRPHARKRCRPRRGAPGWLRHEHPPRR